MLGPRSETKFIGHGIAEASAHGDAAVKRSQGSAATTVDDLLLAKREQTRKPGNEHAFDNEQDRRSGASTRVAMARSLHVRLDDASAAALDVIRAPGLTDSEAVRTALREAAARRRTRSTLQEEVLRLTADDADREETRLVREQMAELAPRSID
jgi:hypothetical protein